jgi:hypothetical protein
MASLKVLMSKAIEVPLNIADRETAEVFAAQAGPFSERVRRNTLAVLAVQRYLSWQGIATNLPGADSWHPALRLAADVADLPLPGLGRIECRVVTAGTTEVEIPLEASTDRSAYMLLELLEQPQSARLIGGFMAKGKVVSSLHLNQLEDMDDFIDNLIFQPSLSPAIHNLLGLGLQEVKAMLDSIKRFGETQADRIYSEASRVLEPSLLSLRQSPPRSSSRFLMIKTSEEDIQPHQSLELSSPAHKNSLDEQEVSLFLLLIKKTDRPDGRVDTSIQLRRVLNDLPLPKGISLAVFTSQRQLGSVSISNAGDTGIQREFIINKNTPLTIRVEFESWSETTEEIA